MTPEEAIALFIELTDKYDLGHRWANNVPANVIASISSRASAACYHFGC